MQESQKFTYKLQLSYKGTHYSGWQFQTENPETVQEYVEKVVQKIAKFQDFKLSGASRTDTGVHASGQTLKITLPKKIEPKNLIKGMNTKLPSDIRVVDCDFVNDDFNVNIDCQSKEYHYYFTIDKKENALVHEAVYPYPAKLDLEKMREACKLLIGEHNFLSFSRPRPGAIIPTRIISECSIEKTNFLTIENEIYYLKIKGPGFLRFMIRFLMGALWDIGSGKLSIEDFQESLKTGKQKGIRTRAPSCGLHLISIKYS